MGVRISLPSYGASSNGKTPGINFHRWFPGEFFRSQVLLRNATEMNFIKIYGGTPEGNESRCDTCKYAGIIQGYAESERIVICGYREESVRIPFKVMECSDYEDKRLPDYWEMKQIALEVRASASGIRAGFVRASELEKSNKTEPSADEAGEKAPAAAVKNP